MTEHAVVIAGGGPTGLMLAGELRASDVDVGIGRITAASMERIWNAAKALSADRQQA